MFIELHYTQLINRPQSQLWPLIWGGWRRVHDLGYSWTLMLPAAAESGHSETNRIFRVYRAQHGFSKTSSSPPMTSNERYKYTSIMVNVFFIATCTKKLNIHYCRPWSRDDGTEYGRSSILHADTLNEMLPWYLDIMANYFRRLHLSSPSTTSRL